MIAGSSRLAPGRAYKFPNGQSLIFVGPVFKISKMGLVARVWAMPVTAATGTGCEMELDGQVLSGMFYEEDFGRGLSQERYVVGERTTHLSSLLYTTTVAFSLLFL